MKKRGRAIFPFAKCPLSSSALCPVVNSFNRLFYFKKPACLTNVEIFKSAISKECREIDSSPSSHFTVIVPHYRRILDTEKFRPHATAAVPNPAASLNSRQSKGDFGPFASPPSGTFLKKMFSLLPHRTHDKTENPKQEEKP